MRAELEQKLANRYPEMFIDRYRSPRETLICFGCECGDGWYWLLNSCFFCIYLWCMLGRFEIPVLSQIKEKYGRLVISFWSADQVSWTIAGVFEDLSEHICEVCGWPGKMNDGGWLQVRCKKHWKI